ncbi:MAG: hypothetical protein V4760_06475, partial [Bdellovibrionota bacterium]
ALTYFYTANYCHNGNGYNRAYPRGGERLRTLLQAPFVSRALGCAASTVNPLCPIQFDGGPSTTPSSRPATSVAASN